MPEDPSSRSRARQTLRPPWRVEVLKPIERQQAKQDGILCPASGSFSVTGRGDEVAVRGANIFRQSAECLHMRYVDGPCACLRTDHHAATIIRVMAQVAENIDLASPSRDCSDQLGTWSDAVRGRKLICNELGDKALVSLPVWSRPVHP